MKYNDLIIRDLYIKGAMMAFPDMRYKIRVIWLRDKVHEMVINGELNAQWIYERYGNADGYGFHRNGKYVITRSKNERAIDIPENLRKVVRDILSGL